MKTVRTAAALPVVLSGASTNARGSTKRVTSLWWLHGNGHRWPGRAGKITRIVLRGAPGGIGLLTAQTAEGEALRAHVASFSACRAWLREEAEGQRPRWANAEIAIVYRAVEEGVPMA